MTDKEIIEDFHRFIRHEAMRANCKQENIIKVISDGKAGNT